MKFLPIDAPKLALVTLATVTLLASYSAQSSVELRKTIPRDSPAKTSAPADKRKDSGDALANTKRATLGRIKAPGATKTAAPAASGDKKFQARMMSADSKANPQGSYFQDSWQSHSLVPTFVDQEQGDEMVALASEIEPSVERVKAPPRQQQQQPHQMPAQNQAEKELTDFAPTSGQPLDKVLRGLNERQHMKHRPTADEYYSEDEDDEEDDLSKGAARDELDGQQEPKDAKLPIEERRPQQHPHEPQQNRSNSRHPTDGGWLPSRALDIKSESGERPQQTGERRRPREKLTDLFGGRESFGSAISKTDAAIEYLKNILKNKQNKGQQNATATTLESEQPRQQVVGSNGAKDKFALNETRSAIELATGSVISMTQPQKSSGQQAKFSIEDVKQVDQYIASALPTTKQPLEEERFFTLPGHQISRQPERFALQRQIGQPSAEQQFQSIGSEVNSQMPLNGTPLGGEYVESLDEFPRGSRQAHPQGQQQMQPIFPYVPRSVQQQQQPQEQRFSHLASAESQPSEALLRPTIGYNLPGGEHQPAVFQHQNQWPPQAAPLVAHSGKPTSSRFFHMRPPGQQENQSGPAESQYLAPLPSEQPASISRLPLELDLKSLNLSNQTTERPTTTVGSKDEPAPFVERKERSETRQRAPPVKQDQLSLAQNSSSQQQPTKPNPPPTAQPQLPPRPQSQANQPLQPLMPAQPQPQQAQPAANEQPEFVQQPRLHHQHQQHPQHHGQEHQIQHHEQPPAPRSQARPVKPPKIVSYNYFESPNESGESELLATNYQLGDALLSSTGGIEQVLSGSELEAIQNQFMTADHPMVPVNDHSASHHQRPELDLQHAQPSSSHNDFRANEQDANLAGLLANLRPEGYSPEALQKLSSPVRQAEEAMRELASNEQPVSVQAPREKQQQAAQPNRPAPNRLSDEAKKKKSLIVYLNHPRSSDMSKGQSDGLAQSVSEQPLDSQISAKEFDSHGLSKEGKHLDISSLRGFGGLDAKEGATDKDGLSVVVIGDAYKYKKIVLLISSKTGGLKFIPMVKDMKK